MLKNKLVTNFFSLFLLQGISYLLPLITIPYMLQTLGINNYGLVALSQSLNMILTVLVDYGFNLTATKQIAVARRDIKKLQMIYSSVLLVKVLLSAVAFTCVMFLVMFIQPFKSHPTLFLLSFGITLGGAILPTWLFQGLEEMKYVTLLNIISRVITTLGIFVLIHSSKDLLLVPTLFSISQILAGILSLILVRSKFNIKIEIPSKQYIKKQLREGLEVFVSNIAITSFTSGNTLMLGILSNEVNVGYYSSGEKLASMASGIVIPFSQTLFPHVSSLVNESKDRAKEFLNRALYVIVSITFPITLFILIFADFIVSLMYGENIKQISVVLRILAFLPTLVGLSNFFGTQTMLTFGYNKEFLKVFAQASLVNMVIVILLVPRFGYIGTAVAALSTEFYITVKMYFFLKKEKLILFKSKKMK
ncbi:flippase [Bacillus smithii]|uniref:flippase n=1 Tax=Bacillus smithii TaxID=1479 RepID=UPI0030C96ECB